MELKVSQMAVAPVAGKPFQVKEHPALSSSPNENTVLGSSAPLGSLSSLYSEQLGQLGQARRAQIRFGASVSTAESRLMALAEEYELDPFQQLVGAAKGMAIQYQHPEVTILHFMAATLTQLQAALMGESNEAILTNLEGMGLGESHPFTLLMEDFLESNSPKQIQFFLDQANQQVHAQLATLPTQGNVTNPVMAESTATHLLKQLEETLSRELSVEEEVKSNVSYYGNRMGAPGFAEMATEMDYLRLATDQMEREFKQLSGLNSLMEKLSTLRTEMGEKLEAYGEQNEPLADAFRDYLMVQRFREIIYASGGQLAFSDETGDQFHIQNVDQKLARAKAEYEGLKGEAEADAVETFLEKPHAAVEEAVQEIETRFGPEILQKVKSYEDMGRQLEMMEPQFQSLMDKAKLLALEEQRRYRLETLYQGGIGLHLTPAEVIHHEALQGARQAAQQLFKSLGFSETDHIDWDGLDRYLQDAVDQGASTEQVNTINRLIKLIRGYAPTDEADEGQEAMMMMPGGQMMAMPGGKMGGDGENFLDPKKLEMALQLLQAYAKVDWNAVQQKEVRGIHISDSKAVRTINQSFLPPGLRKSC